MTDVAYFIWQYALQADISFAGAIRHFRDNGASIPCADETLRRRLAKLPEYNQYQIEKQLNPSPEAKWKRDERERKKPDNPLCVESQAIDVETPQIPIETGMHDLIGAMAEQINKEMLIENEKLRERVAELEALFAGQKCDIQPKGHELKDEILRLKNEAKKLNEEKEKYKSDYEYYEYYYTNLAESVDEMAAEIPGLEVERDDEDESIRLKFDGKLVKSFLRKPL